MTDGSQNMSLERQLDVPTSSGMSQADITDFPFDPEWDHPETWLETLKTRRDLVAGIKEFEGNSYEVAAKNILLRIALPLTDIAIAQKQQGYGGPKSWFEYNPEAGASLDQKIEEIFDDKQCERFLIDNHSFQLGLELIRETLIFTKDPHVIYERHSEYMKACIEANKNNQIILFIPFDSDWTHPANQEGGKTQICEATASVIVPLGFDDREKFDESVIAIQEFIKADTLINVIVGNNVMRAGFELLSSTVGEAFKLKDEEHGFYLAINNIWNKKGRYWEMMFGDSTNFSKVMNLLLVSHEQGHLSHLVRGKFGEIPADILAIITTLKIAKDQNLTEEDVIKGILTEYVLEIVKSVSDKDFIEGYKPNPDNELFEGYLLSGVIIINAIAESGVVGVDNDEKLYMNLSQEKLDKFILNLRTAMADFKSGNTKGIERAAANFEAIKIIKLYRQKINEL